MVHAMNVQRTAAAGAETEGGRRPTGVSAPAGISHSLAGLGGAGPTVVADVLAGAGPADQPRPGGSAGPSDRPDPEVVARPERRRFTTAYKLDILKQADACSQPGQIGALLRREGLYSSCLANWRTLRSQGRLGDSVGPKRGASTAAGKSTDRVRLRQLERDNARLTTRLAKAELILDIQKKVSELLGISLTLQPNDGSDS